MKIIKDKNYLCFTLPDKNGKEKPYKYNINDGCFYGTGKRALENLPRGFKKAFKEEHYENLYWKLLAYVSGVTQEYYDSYIPKQAKEFSMWYDKLLSLGYSQIFLNCFNINTYLKYSKYLGSYRQQDPHCSEFIYANFLVYAERRELAQTPCYPALKSINDDVVFRYILFNTVWATEQNIRYANYNVAEIIAYYLTTGYLLESFGYGKMHSSISKILEYVKYCQEIKKPYIKTKNFLREFVETKREYMLRKDELDKVKFSDNYSKHPLAWRFNYSGFTVVIPKDGNDLIEEGRRMSHCVGSYIDKVADNETYICFIRKIAEPDKPYITCEVKPNGTIGQYYLAFDKQIANSVDKAVKEKYQEYLKQVW